MSNINIKNLGDNIVERIEILQVGSGEFDKIGVHRISKNICGCSKCTVVMIPGANSDFNTSFQNMAIYLAKYGVDVWGIDFRYSFVPNNTPVGYPYCIASDCTFMRNWDTNLHISDLKNVVKLAEMFSRNGVFLIGFSQGAYFAYRYASQHSEIKGIIPMDIAYNIDPTYTDVIERTRADVDRRTAKINSNIFYEDTLTEKYIAGLALIDPDGESTIIPGLTNRQVFLFAATSTGQLTNHPIPGYKYCQGDLSGLRHTDYNFLLNQSFKLNSFQSILTLTELRKQWLVSPPEIPNISTPIFHVGAEFGFGPYGLYTPNTIHNFSPDVSTQIISDYGHADLIYSNTAEDDVWKYILKWIKDHSK